MDKFGDYIRQRREALRASEPGFSLRKVAAKIGVAPSFLSKVERGQDPPPSEPKIRALATLLGEDADVLLGMAGKVSSDLQDAICRRPQLFAQMIRNLKDLPDQQVEQVARRVRDGRW